MSDQASHLRGLMEHARRLSEHGSAGVISILPQSVPTGAVSYAPAHHALSSKPSSYPRVTNAPLNRHGLRIARAIAISSGKGGVGKSNLAVNLAVALSGMGLRVCLLDADLGLANADVLCNLGPKKTLEHVVSGECRLADAMLLAPGGFRLLPGASGVTRMADLHHDSRQFVLQQLAALERIADVILIDCGAGISANVVGFAAAAHKVLVTTTPEPTAITDGYAMIKALFAQGSGVNVSLVVNMTCSDSEGPSVFARINRVSKTFLNRELDFAGAVPTDPAVLTAVRQRVPFVLYAPQSPATRAVRHLAARLVGRHDSNDQTAPKAGFFTRLAMQLGILELVD